jgi:DNA-binding NtrC family response regulator
MKPIDKARLMISVRNATRSFAMAKKIHRLESLTRKRHEFEGIIGVSKPMQAIYSVIENVAPSDVTVLVTGDSGTGKELLAKAIHNRSQRKNGPFIAINCAAIPRDLIESELFGHEKGSFTGATSSRTGCIEMADGGTLLLDEICEMDASVQSKLLRFLQEKNFRRVGGNGLVDVNVRIIAATNRSPKQEVEKGTFREDLYFRLNVIPIHIPRLRDRKEDIPLLAMHFLAKFSERSGKHFTGFTAEALERMMSYAWPGNVRELENTVERIVVLGIPPTVTEKMLPEAVLDSATNSVKVEVGEIAGDPSEILPFTVIEKKAIAHAIRCCRGNISMAAKRLGLGQATLYRKIKKYGLSR